MLTLSRCLARDLRAVVRRLRPGRARPPLAVALTAGPEGLNARCQAGEVAAMFHRTGALPEASLALPLDALADCAGAGDAPVTLTALSATRVEVGWARGGVPGARVYDLARPPETFPDPPPA